MRRAYLVWRDGLTLYKLLLLMLSVVFICQQNVLFADMMSGWYGVPFSKIVIVVANISFFALFCITVFAKSHPLRSAKFLALGALTYPLYLVHQNIGYVIFNAFGNEQNRYLIAMGTFALMLAIAWCIYRYIEKPIAPRLKVNLAG